MRIAGFILAVDSFLVRKGLVSLLNQIEGARVIREFDDPDRLVQYMNLHAGGFLIISQTLFTRVSEMFLSQPGLSERTILLKEHAGSPEGEEGYASISTAEGKEEIIGKIKQLIDAHLPAAGHTYSTPLTPREKTIVRLVCTGLTNRQIADRLFLSSHTVNTHRKNINNKLGIKSVPGLIVYAIVNNIITIEEVSREPAQ